MEKKTCCVTGHRVIPAERSASVRQALTEAIIQAVHDDYLYFISGFAEGADLMFAQCVLGLQAQYPHILLDAAIPYAKRIDRLDARGRVLLSKCNHIEIISQNYHMNCFTLRNHYMVKRSGRVIALYDGRDKGGTRQTMCFARELGREILFIPI